MVNVIVNVAKVMVMEIMMVNGGIVSGDNSDDNVMMKMTRL